MAGSCAFQFGRASYEAGLLSRRQLARDAWANVKFRLQGSTDEATDALRERIFTSIAGPRVVDLQRLVPRVLAGVLPRVYPQMLEIAYEHQDAGRPVYIVTAASQEMAELLAHVLVFDGGIGARSEIVDGVYTGRPDGPFTYREGKAAGDPRARRARGLSTSPSPTRTRTRSPTCRCSAPSATRSRSTPTRRSLKIAREEGWEVMRFERLGRRVRAARRARGDGAVGGVGREVAAGSTGDARRRRSR